MGRPSKLTTEQWEELGNRLLGGETAYSLSKEYGVSNASISERFSERNRNIRTIAESVIETNRVVASLPKQEQAAVNRLITETEAIGANAVSAVLSASEAAKLLNAGALAQLRGIILTRPLTDDDREAMKDAAGMLKMGNEAMAPVNSMMNLTKDRVARQLDAAEVVEAEDINVREMPMIDAAKAYQDFVSG